MPSINTGQKISVIKSSPMGAGTETFYIYGIEFITPRTCARGKVIGHVIVVVVA